jgi:glycosyltransferase involved in cell wall biosynthesis
VRDGATGLLINPQRPAAFVAALARLAISPALRLEMGQAAREDSEAYAWDAVMAGLLANYRDAVSAGRQRFAAHLAGMSDPNARTFAKGVAP